MNEVVPMRARSTGQWWVQVGERPYGPYAMEQLKGFVADGRINGATRITDRKDGVWVEARRIIGLMGPASQENADEAANVFVHAAIVSGAWNAFMAALEGMGAVCDMGPNLWLLRTCHSAGVIRNTLSQTLERGDHFVVIDATRDRLAWFNLGPEADAKISRTWNGPLKAAHNLANR